MLVLVRRIGEGIIIKPPGAEPVEIIISKISRGIRPPLGDRVKIAIDAPPEVRIARSEIYDEKRKT